MANSDDDDAMKRDHTEGYDVPDVGRRERDLDDGGTGYADETDEDLDDDTM